MIKSDPLIIGVGSILLKGITPCLDLLINLKDCREEVNLLLVNCGDFRHVIKTISSLKNKQWIKKVNFYIMERNSETIARELYHILLSTSFDLSPPERAELILDSYGNILVTEHTYSSIRKSANLIRNFFYGRESPFFFKIDKHLLKLKECDELALIYKNWENDSGINFQKLFDERLREYYSERYEFRKNLVDWDYNMKLKDLGATLIYEQEFQKWRNEGIAFQMREGGHTMNNMTLITTLKGSIV